jgi:hypothetical protein
VSCDTGDVSAPSSNTDAVVTFAAVSGNCHVVSGLVFSYIGGTPAGGNLKIEDGAGNTVFNVDITSQGCGFIPFSPAKKGTAGRAMIITLTAGGSGVSGKLTIPNHWTEQ